MTITDALDDEELATAADQQGEAQRAKLSLEEVVALGEKLRDVEAAIMAQEAILKELRDRRERLAASLLPRALSDLGLKEFTLTDGQQIVLKEIISAQITDERREEAHRYLRDNNYGDLIKNEVKVVFGMGEDLYARALYEYVRMSNELRYGELRKSEQVHPMTLKAFVTEKLRRGEKLPAELLGLSVFHRAEIKKEKRKKV